MEKLEINPKKSIFSEKNAIINEIIMPESHTKIEVPPLDIKNKRNSLNALNLSIVDYDLINTLAKKTREKINGSLSTKTPILAQNILKGLVSRKKFRFNHDGYDLDLTYITDKLIAMGFPASNLEKLYRNGVNEVINFFNERHRDHYKVYNLCSERQYPPNTFHKQAHYPFDDHEAPPIDLIMPFCQDLDEFLAENEENVAAIHCKAGKGRTGTFICCFLIYKGYVKSAHDALEYYGIMRTENGKGVTIPSQIRYVHYFEKMIKCQLEHPLPKLNVIMSKVTLVTIPNFSSFARGCTPYFKIENDNMRLNYRKNFKINSFSKHHEKVEFPLNNYVISGDVKITFYNKTFLGKEKMLSFWFNTYFLPLDGVFTLKKRYLDKAHKDKSNKLFDENLKVQLNYAILDEEFKKINLDDVLS